ncbi:MAG: phosphodiester glycosidase family protein, partial [Anaerolineales bacterium]
NFHVGDKIGISIDVVSLKEDCEEPLPLNWANTYASIGGSFFFLKDGGIPSFDNPGATLRHPRTAICYNTDYIYFVVVDGRQQNYSIGMTIDELAQFCRDDLAATWGINQDGGGSSTMWIQGQIVNSPSDGAERPVANGMMMILVEPMERSDAFQVNDEVKTSEASKVWLGPGTNFAVHSSVPEGASGRIVPHMNDLNGVYAKGTHWWKVDFGSKVGWLPEETLILVYRPEFIIAFRFAPGAALNEIGSTY